MISLEEFSSPQYQAKELNDRLESFRCGHKGPVSKEKRIAKLGYSYNYGKFRSFYDPEKNNTDINYGKVFGTNIFGRSNGAKTRMKLMKAGHIISFLSIHAGIIPDLADKADLAAAKKVNGGSILFIDWSFIDSLRNTRMIYNISYKSCVNKKGEFDAMSWIFFYNTYIEYYYNSIYNLF